MTEENKINTGPSTVVYAVDAERKAEVKRELDRAPYTMKPSSRKTYYVFMANAAVFLVDCVMCAWLSWPWWSRLLIALYGCFVVWGLITSRSVVKRANAAVSSTGLGELLVPEGSEKLIFTAEGIELERGVAAGENGEKKTILFHLSNGDVTGLEYCEELLCYVLEGDVRVSRMDGVSRTDCICIFDYFERMPELLDRLRGIVKAATEKNERKDSQFEEI